MSARESGTGAEAERKDATAAAVGGEATGSAGSESKETGKAVGFLPREAAWRGRSKPVRRTCPGSSEPAVLHLRVPEEESVYKPLSFTRAENISAQKHTKYQTLR